MAVTPAANAAASAAFSAIANDVKTSLAQHGELIQLLQAEIKAAHRALAEQGGLVSSLRADLSAAQEDIQRQAGQLATLRTDYSAAYSRQKQRGQICALEEGLAKVQDRLTVLSGRVTQIESVQEIDGLGPGEDDGSTPASSAELDEVPGGRGEPPFQCESDDEEAEEPACEAAEAVNEDANADASANALPVDPALVAALAASSEWPGYGKERLLRPGGCWMSGAGESSASVTFDLGRPSLLARVRLSTQGSRAGPARWPAEARLLWRPAAVGPWLEGTAAELEEPAGARHEAELAVRDGPVVARQVRLDFDNGGVLYLPPDGLSGADGSGGGDIAVGCVHFH